jgi:hypothetical protein
MTPTTAHARARPAAAPLLSERVMALDWAEMSGELDSHGCATTGPLLTAEECAELAAGYETDDRFRSRIIMARHSFGRGEYKYYAYPLPETVAALRAALYPPLAAIANRWHETMGIAARYPDRGSAQADAAAPALWRRRLQLPASGHLWRARISVADRVPAVAARR